MPHSFLREIHWQRLALGMVLAGVLCLAGCGRRGALEEPPGTAAAQKTEEQAQSASPSTPNPLPRKKKTPITKPKEPFLLDPLL